jgi:hypothetical protein
MIIMISPARFCSYRDRFYDFYNHNNRLPTSITIFMPRIIAVLPTRFTWEKTTLPIVRPNRLALLKSRAAQRQIESAVRRDLFVDFGQ